MTNYSNAFKRPIPHYDVRAASQNYSNIATVLAGFAFVAVVLVVEQRLSPDISYTTLLRDRASITFLLAFFGCVVSAFTFAVVAAEEELAPRSHAMAFLGGGIFALSTIYVLSGLVMLVKLFLSPTVIVPARWIFGVAPALSRYILFCRR